MAEFRARARTIDMLGRQQIAGIPTAISELFKNAYDAYARNVVANYFREKSLFVLRDDGVGMTEEEFADRWLTVGTESKIVEGKAITPPPGQVRRPVLGEKGIGRLAIAAIGPQVLIVTQSRTPRAKGVAAFVNWRFFETPGINLDDINVPTLTFACGSPPSKELVDQLLEQARLNASTLRARIPNGLYRQITAELASFKVDPRSLSRILGKPSLNNEHGTQFYISPVDDTLAADIDENASTDTAPPLKTTLLGFTNTMTPRHPKGVIETAFYDHRTETDYVDLIAEDEFFTPGEFASADHHIRGTFDPFGTFKGTISTYDLKPKGVAIPWKTGNLTETRCGPFGIKLAVVQGTERQSMLPADKWSPLARKMDKLGGLYIYNDNVRVLPYGNADYDFLDIERNRTKSASYYYFSYRRMFGVIELSRKTNARLREKAGREGFIQSTAYRQFREILKHFFVVVAGEFFREKGDQADDWLKARDELEEAYRAKQELDRQRTIERRQLRAMLDQLFKKLSNAEPNKRVRLLIRELEGELSKTTGRPQKHTDEIAAIESNAYRQLNEQRTSYRLDVPRGFGKDRDLQIEIAAYAKEYAELERSVFDPALSQIRDLVATHLKKARLPANDRRRLSLAVKLTAERGQKLLEGDVKDLEGQIATLRDRVSSLAQSFRDRLLRELKSIESEVRTPGTNGKAKDIAAQHADYERRLTEVALSAHQALGEVRTQVSQLGTTREGQPSQLAVYEAMESELLDLRERSKDDLELAQLGMAVRVINHEFDATIRSVRAGLRELRPWAAANTKLEPVYRRLQTSFNHLDAYLGLFTPLQRRLQRSSTAIAGSELYKFLSDLFGESLKREGVSLKATSAFKRYRFVAMPSTFYPVFVNIVDNAIFWLRRHNGRREISLDVLGERLAVSNTGPPIPERDRSRIFDYGFSRKPSGQGLGLFISRQVLRGEDFDIEAVSPLSGYSVTFILKHVKDK